MRFLATIILAIFVVYPVVCFCGDNVDNKTSERLVRDYFPLEEGWAYMYRDMEGKASYTLIKAYERNGLKGYYFMTHDEQHKESPLFIGTGLGTGFYFIWKDNLYTVPTVGTLDLETISPSKAVLLLRNPLQDGANTTLKRKTTTVVYTVKGPVSITVPAGTFNDCMKVTWLTIFYNGAGDRNNMKNYGTTERIAWLARGVGVIRFENDLGFSMGLEEYVSPKK